MASSITIIHYVLLTESTLSSGMNYEFLGYTSYLGLLKTEHYTNHPCLRVFTQIMCDIRQDILDRKMKIAFSRNGFFHNTVIAIDSTVAGT